MAPKAMMVRHVVRIAGHVILEPSGEGQLVDSCQLEEYGQTGAKKEGRGGFAALFSAGGMSMFFDDRKKVRLTLSVCARGLVHRPSSMHRVRLATAGASPAVGLP